MAARCMSKTTQFKFFAPWAKKVSVTGNFNNWDTGKKSIAAKKDTKGNWVACISLKPGRYEYKFYVDGNWAEDPDCNNRVPNPLGTQNCVIDVR